jgi:hypothetical protein
MEDGVVLQDSSDPLTEALSAFLGHSRITSKLARVLAYGSSKGAVSYDEIKQIIGDDSEEMLLLADEWRLLLPVRTAKSSNWEDRLLIFKDGEAFEMPNIVRYVAREALTTGVWNSKNAIGELFKELGDPNCKQIPELVRSIAEESGSHKTTGNQIKMICLRLGLSNRVDSLIAELKAAGIISPRLSSLPEVTREGSPIYELNPAVVIGLSQ